MLFIVYAEDNEAISAEIRQSKTPEHLAYLDRYKDVIVLAGALLTDDAGKRVGSVSIINVKNRAAAEAFVAGEPFRNAGLYRSIKISRMRKGQWNPAAAPKTAEGD
ncbi:MAG TPA: YciI family protein [Stellaceae bacterium]|nr:YciI family protein [Stellaceae bacterium]